MDRLFLLVGDVRDPRFGGGDSFTDRLSCKYTVFLLILFALLVTTQTQSREDRIACWCPDHFTESQIDYTNELCWVQNTYYLPFEDYIPKEGVPRDTIGYYQWISLFLACQAVVFYLPRAFWNLFNTKSGIAVSTITDAAIECQLQASPDTRVKTLKYMIKHMGRFLKETSRKQLLSSKLEDFRWRIYGNYLTWFYLFVKCIYIANALGQLFVINKFLGTQYHLYGLEVIEKLVNGDELSVSHRFPRVTMCDIKIRLLGNLHRYTVQCTLAVNLFNEKIFIIIWFWFIFVCIASSGSFILWFWRAIYSPQEISYIKARLIAMNKINNPESKLVISFVRNYLRRDGMFLVRLVGKNSSDLIAAELICGLFDHYKENKRSVERLQSMASVDPDLQDRPNNAQSFDYG